MAEEKKERRFLKKINQKQKIKSKLPKKINQRTANLIFWGGTMALVGLAVATVVVTFIRQVVPSKPVVQVVEKSDKGYQADNRLELFLNGYVSAYFNYSGEEALQKEEIEKMKGIVAYFSNDEKQREFNLSDDAVRGFELQFRTQEMSDIGINEGAEKAVQYYLENVVSDTATEDAIRFNKDDEESLYFSAMYLLSMTGDEKKIDKYSKQLENTRNMKILQKYYGKEESKKAPENTSKGKNKKESKKKRGK